MADKYLHPDKKLAIKYVIAAFVLYVMDYLIPYLGFISLILLFLGVKPFMHEHNNHFKIAYKSFKKMSVAYVIMVLSAFIPEIGLFTATSVSNLVHLVALGISTIYFIYLTHYFTEGILLDAKTAKVNYVKLGLNTPWILFGLFIMANFICTVSFKAPIPTLTVACSIMLCIYYCMKLYQAFPRVYK